ncbi:MAG TPA: DNA polymerase III subunit gamma/tau [Candidatus Saccharimonadales bacterium]|nr:DNA polymerase III subunit gamma/tau [Candidatus Saccharimonadales bacterium]
MSELALYRKYRSTTFDEVVGQPHVVMTLKSAIAAGRISHAYLLTGQRGVGKTSVARILARSLNCLSDGEKPCNTCNNCTAALNGNLDIIEIDAASNRGIDEIRDLKEKINLAPSLGQYKVYIIDEVHMLTDAAFNALLKTLEEPPAHAVFIMATTEAHKLPATIISRTQRFNLHQIEVADINAHITMVATREQIGVTPEALAMIASASGGSIRDALSLLDQVSALGGEVTADDVRQLLGWGNDEEITWLYQAIIDGQMAAVLGQIDQLYDNGAQPSQVINQLISVVRADLRRKLSEGQPAGQLLALMESLIAATKSALPQYALETAIARYSQTSPPAVTEPIAAPAKAAAEPLASPAAAEPKPPKAIEPEPRPTPEAAAPTPSPNQNDFDVRWMKALAEVKAHNNSLYALLCSCDTKQTETGIELISRFSFHRDRLMEPKNLAIIEAGIKQAFGREIPLVAHLANQAPPAKSTESSEELISSALEILGGEVVE